MSTTITPSLTKEYNILCQSAELNSKPAGDFYISMEWQPPQRGVASDVFKICARQKLSVKHTWYWFGDVIQMYVTHFKLWKQCSSIIHIPICCWGLNIVKDQIQSGFGQCDFILSILLDSSFSSSVNIAIEVNSSDQTGLDQNCSVWHNVRQHNLHQLFTDESLLSTGVVQQHCVYNSWL